MMTPATSLPSFFQTQFGESKYTSICRRLQRELDLLSEASISYTISSKPLYQKKYGYAILMEIRYIYMDYIFFMYITEAYPFEQPIIQVDYIPKSYKQFRVQDGLEHTSVSSLHPYISTFIEECSEARDLISITQLLERKKSDGDDAVRTFLYQFGKCYAPTVHLLELYQWVCRGIDLL